MRIFREPARQTEIVDDCDVLVVGGGPAGVTAAIGAAREKKNTLLVERYGVLGGMATGGLVIAWPGFSPDGPYWYKGIGLEVFRRARIRDAVTFMPHGELFNAIFSPEVLKLVFLEMVEEAGVRLRLHSWAVSAYVEKGRLRGIVVESKEGRQAVLAKMVVDATGDMDIAHLAGAPMMHGHMHQMGLPDMSLCFRIGNINRKRFEEAIGNGDRPSNSGTAKPMFDEIEKVAGSPFWIRSNVPDEGSAWSMAIKFMEADCLKVSDLTRVEVEGRKKLDRAVQILRRSVPGFENAYLAETASQVAVRESRQIAAEYVFTEEDALEGRRFPDAVGQGDNCSRATLFDIPYRCLVPQKVEGILAAGRGISAQPPRGMHKIRPIPHCLVTGEAAGCAAAIAVETGLSAREIDVTELRRRLAGHGANIELSPEEMAQTRR